MSNENHGRIDYVEFAATDLGQIKSFYHDAFGWTFTDYGPDYTSFNDGRLAGGFHRREQSSVASGPLVVLYATKLETMEDKITAAGGTVVKAIFSFPGGRRFHFRDPGGNELAVWSDRS